MEEIIKSCQMPHSVVVTLWSTSKKGLTSLCLMESHSLPRQFWPTVPAIIGPGSITGWGTGDTSYGSHGTGANVLAKNLRFFTLRKPPKPLAFPPSSLPYTLWFSCLWPLYMLFFLPGILFVMFLNLEKFCSSLKPTATSPGRVVQLLLCFPGGLLHIFII